MLAIFGGLGPRALLVLAEDIDAIAFRGNEESWRGEGWRVKS